MSTATAANPRNIHKHLDIFGERVLIQRDDPATVTPGGIVLPNSASDKSDRGTIVALGTGKRIENGGYIPLDMRIGDRVIFNNYMGQEVTIDDETYVLLEADNVLLRLPAKK